VKVFFFFFLKKKKKIKIILASLTDLSQPSLTLLKTTHTLHFLVPQNKESLDYFFDPIFVLYESEIYVYQNLGFY
jgi:hypothetical protein